jgi:hypothetical protein
MRAVVVNEYVRLDRFPSGDLAKTLGSARHFYTAK